MNIQYKCFFNKKTKSSDNRIYIGKKYMQGYSCKEVEKSQVKNELAQMWLDLIQNELVLKDQLMAKEEESFNIIHKDFVQNKIHPQNSQSNKLQI